MADDFQALVAHVRKIERLLLDAESARKLPDTRVHTVRQIKLYVDSTYGTRHSDAHEAIITRMREAAEAEERRAGATKARFDLLDTVREMRS
jgi:hypothetical protein